jgi:hypothetical protein
LVKKWLKENSAKRWAERFSVRGTSSVSDDMPDSRKLLVLKTTFDPVWDAFNLHGLSDTILNTWTKEISFYERRWSRLWNSGPEPGSSTLVDTDYAVATASGRIPKPSTVTEPTTEGVGTAAERSDGPVVGTPMVQDENLWLSYLRKSRYGKAMAVTQVLDVSKVGFTDARWLVSRKRTAGLGDQLNKLKREALDANSHLKDLWALCESSLPLDSESGDEAIGYLPLDMEE